MQVNALDIPVAEAAVDNEFVLPWDGGDNAAAKRYGYSATSARKCW